MNYEYGVKYDIAGIKPGLPDDVIVEVESRNFRYGQLAPAPAGQIKWKGVLGFRIVDERYKPKTNDAPASIASLMNAQGAINQARKSSEFNSHNAELADQADAILQAIIDNLKAERIPAEASYHLANAQNELSACAKLLEGDKTLADAVFCIGEKLAGIRKGEL